MSRPPAFPTFAPPAHQPPTDQKGATILVEVTEFVGRFARGPDGDAIDTGKAGLHGVLGDMIPGDAVNRHGRWRVTVEFEPLGEAAMSESRSGGFIRLRDVPDRLQDIRDSMARGVRDEAEGLTLGLYIDVLREIAEGGAEAQELAAAALEAETILVRVVLAGAPEERR